MCLVPKAIFHNLIFLAVVIRFMGVVTVCAESVPTGFDIFAKVMDSRERIQCGHVEVVTSYKDVVGIPVNKQWNIWFEDTKLRSDVVRDGITEVVCLDCYSKRTRLYYTTQPPPIEGGKMALTFFDGHSKPYPTHFIPEPKWFGFLSLPIETSQYQFPLEMYGSKPEKYAELPKVGSDTVLDIDCWKVDYKLSGSISYSLWVDKTDYSRVVCAESRFDAEENVKIHFIDRVEVKTEKFRGNLWFPTTMYYKRTENTETTCNVKTTIKVISLNEPLPPNTFSPKGIGILKPDTPVAWHLDRNRPMEGELVWNGNEIVAVDEFGKMMRESTRFSSFNIFLILLGAAMICFGIGLKLVKKRQ